jgi:fused signal recognition particle receptor
MLFSKSSDEKKPGFFERMKNALGATKANLVVRIEAVLSRGGVIDDALLDDLEEAMLGADIGVKATTQIMSAIRVQCRHKQLKTPEDVRGAIRNQLLTVLEAPTRRTHPASGEAPLQVWMVVGVNGTGKTTTVGKLAARASQEGRKVLVCAADTFRPAAIEQLAVWAERSGADLIRSRQGADPSSVLHDALAAAVARGCNTVIVDTAGRLHTRGNLMQELGKMRRVASRQVLEAPH